jgi:hypothetical protein
MSEGRPGRTAPHTTAANRVAALAAVTAVLAGIAGNRSDAVVTFVLTRVLPSGGGPLAEIGVYGVLALILAGAMYYLTRRLSTPALKSFFTSSIAETVEENGRAPKYLAVTLALSDLSRRGPNGPIPDVREIALAKTALDMAKTLITPDQKRDFLDVLCDSAGGYADWKWQQPLRVLAHNFDRVKVMGFVLSDRAAPQYVELFQPLVQLLRPDMIFNPLPAQAVASASTVELTKYAPARDRLSALSELAMKQLGCHPRDVCIDITGGTKPYTAAATVMTLDSVAVFCYVEPSPQKPGYTVVVYNATMTN